MNLAQGVAQFAAENPFSDYLSRKAGLLWFVLIFGALLSAGAWLLDDKTDVDLPAEVFVWPAVASAVSLVLLIMSV